MLLCLNNDAIFQNNNYDQSVEKRTKINTAFTGYKKRGNAPVKGGGKGALECSLGVGEPPRPTNLSLRQTLFILLPCLRQETVFHDSI